MALGIRAATEKGALRQTKPQRHYAQWAKAILKANEIPLWYQRGVPRKSLEPLYAYAFAQFNARRYDLALEILEGLMAAEFYHFDYHYGAGLCHWHLKQLPQAWLRFGVAMQLSVQDPRPYFYLLKILMALDERELALPVGQALSQLMAKDERMHHMQAEVRHLMRQLEEGK